MKEVLTIPVEIEEGMGIQGAPEKKPYPLGNRVLVEPIHETASSHIEMVEEQEPVKGTVLEVGPEVTTVEKGDEVVFKKYAAQEELDDFLIFREPDLLCVMR